LQPISLSLRLKTVGVAAKQYLIGSGHEPASQLIAGKAACRRP
jgi:deoxyinosine 3'endonuclease (endonuclease V)